MDESGSGLREYRQRLEADPDEFAQLLNMILINVTGFFRDPETWEYLQEDVDPAGVDRAGEGSPIRVWSAGCASGEEPYTVAMLLAEALGEEDYRRRVKIYATDLDEEALAEARLAVYTPKQLADVPEELRERYFQPVDKSRSATTCRRAVVFGKNDLLQDAPISRVDLLVSRNTLMYFAPSAQERILANFYFALTPRASSCSARPRRSEPDEPVRRVRPQAARIREEPGRDAAAPPASEGPTARTSAAPRRRCSRRRVRAGAAGRAHRRPRRPGAGDQPRGPRNVRAADARRRPAAQRPRGLVPAGRAALGDRPGRTRNAARSPRTSTGRRRPATSRYLNVQVTPLVDQGRRARRDFGLVRRHHAAPGAPLGARAGAARPRDRLRGAAVDGRGARDDERGAPVHERGARDDERGAPVDQRGARDHERGAPVDERGARDDERRAARPDRRVAAASTRSSPRSSGASSSR